MWSPEEVQELLNFLIDKSKKTQCLRNIKELGYEFKASHKTVRSENSVAKRIRKLCSEVHQLKDIDEETKKSLRMAFNSAQLTTSKKIWSVDENQILQNFLVDKSEAAQGPLDVKQLSKEFKELHDTNRSHSSVETRIHKFQNEIHYLKNIDEETRDQLMFALGTSEDTRKNVPWGEEDNALVKFLGEESKKVVVLNLSNTCQKYIETHNSTRTRGSVLLRIHSIRHKMHELKNIDEETKQRMIRALRAPDEEDKTNSKRPIWSPEEDNELVLFLIDQLKDAEHANFLQIAKNYSETPNTTRSARSVTIRLHLIQKRIPFLIGIDHETKEFLNAALNPYETCDESDRTEDMLDFLAKAFYYRKAPLADSTFLTAYIRATMPNAEYGNLLHIQYRSAKQRIIWCRRFPYRSRIRMMFVSSAPITPLVLEKLRRHAFVELDKNQAISFYAAFDGRLHFQKSVHVALKRPSLTDPTSSDAPPLKMPKVEVIEEKEETKPELHEVKLEEPDS